MFDKWEKAKQGLEACHNEPETGEECRRMGCPYWDAPMYCVRALLTDAKEAMGEIGPEDMQDLERVRAVRSGAIKKAVCHDYTIINGDFYREHGGWQWPHTAKETRLMQREDLLNGWGHGWEESWHIGDEGEADEITLVECVWIGGQILCLESGVGYMNQGANKDRYNMPGGVRIWQGNEAPTEEQRKGEAWQN